MLARMGIAEAPVPVEQIARRLGAQVTYEGFDGDISGMLFRDEGRAVIGVNSRHAPTRQRFTVAHEIGHLEMHMPDPDRPHLLLGTCNGCLTWVVANLDKWTMIKLPMSDLFEE